MSMKRSFLGLAIAGVFMPFVHCAVRRPNISGDHMELQVNYSGSVIDSATLDRSRERSGLEYDSASNLTYPPMGFNSWNFYHCNIDERIVMRTADAFVEKGLAAAGYKYVNIDDCWMVDRNPDGTIRPDPVRFPSGMKALADYVHSKGLLFGLYTAQAEFTCQKRPGSYNHELQDAATYCEWGIDYLKIDHCGGAHHPQLNTSWILFKQGFDKCQQQTGRRIVMGVSSCRSPTTCGRWVADVANLWRTTADIQANWGSVMKNLDINNQMAAVARVGHYNDPDMLQGRELVLFGGGDIIVTGKTTDGRAAGAVRSKDQVGNAGLSQSEARAHFSLWNIVMAPLLARNSIIDMDSETLSILTSPEVVAINKDTLGKQGTLVTPSNATGSEVWARPMSDGSVAAALLNRGGEATSITAHYQDVGLKEGSTATVRDLWQRKELGKFTATFSAQVPPHDVVLVRITPAQSEH